MTSVDRDVVTYSTLGEVFLEHFLHFLYNDDLSVPITRTLTPFVLTFVLCGGFRISSQKRK